MGDYLCKYCQDQGCRICSKWCYKEGRWVFIGCRHKNCMKKNGTLAGNPWGPTD